jgi:spermidine synthase
MIDIFRDMKLMASLSGNALADPRVEIHVIDAQKYLSRTTDYWDLIIMDLPDPNNLSVGRLYTRSFFRLVFKRLSAHGVMVTQATSPFYAPKAFWCIVETINSVGNENIPPMESYAAPFHVYVPSFGDWGFVMASKKPLNPSEINLVPGLELGYLDQSILPTLFVFPKDSLPREKVETNRLNDQILVKYYQKGWRRFGP